MINEKAVDVVVIDPSQITKDRMKELGTQLIGVISVNGRECPIIVCPKCHFPKLLDCGCDSCHKRQLEKKFLEIKSAISKASAELTTVLML
ncbi:MAG: hypothetical protein ACD_11C00103G0017 [uncultured bacterium]|nr:MAG: hypothetical protein ACD_11C00103G0017 [uncultured bacterium]HBR71486.1 hypothetical protein [Candidatus Moranbacteria bacterium]